MAGHVEQRGAQCRADGELIRRVVGVCEELQQLDLVLKGTGLRDGLQRRRRCVVQGDRVLRAVLAQHVVGKSELGKRVVPPQGCTQKVGGRHCL
jgi:hypothetical protein